MKKIFIILFFFSFLGFIGCAGPLNNAKVRALRERTLITAGFKQLPLSEAQETQLHGFPENKITTLQRGAKTYYIYPDLNHHRVLIGTNRQFTQYNELVAEQLTPLYKKAFHNGKQEELEWAESGVWDN